MAKTFTDPDGKSKCFDKDGFAKAIRLRNERTGDKIQNIEAAIAQKVCVETSTVHGWRMPSQGGPQDLDTIRSLGNFLVGDPDAFLKTINKENHMTKLTDRQLNAFKRVHDEIKLFLKEYTESNGFCNYLDKETKKSISELPDSATEDDVMDAYFTSVEKAECGASARLAHVFFVLEQEYFDLHGTKIYDELWELISNMREVTHDLQPISKDIRLLI